MNQRSKRLKRSNDALLVAMPFPDTTAANKGSAAAAATAAATAAASTFGRFVAHSLPTEIFLLILAFLPPSSLLSLMRLGHRFFELSAPFVWHHVRILNFRGATSFWSAVNSKTPRGYLYASYVRSLEIRFWDGPFASRAPGRERILDYCLERLPNLRAIYITLPTITVLESQLQSQPQSLSQSQSQSLLPNHRVSSSGLTVLHAQLNEIGRGPFTGSLFNYIASLDHRTNPLTELNLSACAFLYTNSLLNLIRVSPLLTTLRLSTCGDEDCGWEWAHACVNHVRELALSCPLLREVDLADCCCRRGGDAFLELAHACEGLRDLRLKLHGMTGGKLLDALPWLTGFVDKVEECEVIVGVPYMFERTLEEWCEEAKDISKTVSVEWTKTNVREA